MTDPRRDPMPLHVQIMLLVLLSALLHAVWNAQVKVHTDRTLTLGLVSLLSGAVALSIIPFSAVPTGRVWLWLIPAVACHLLFKVFLLAAYRTGDFSHVYPLARGSAPLMVAAVSGEALDAGQIGGVVLISLGVFVLAFDKAVLQRSKGWPVFYALMTGLFICAYTVIDGHGVRLSPSSLGFAAWLFLMDGILFASGALYLRRRVLVKTLGLQLVVPLVAGVISLMGYYIIIWAVRQDTMAPVAALRETGVLFAALIGTLILKEPFGLRRILASLFVVAGIAAVSLA